MNRNYETYTIKELEGIVPEDLVKKLDAGEFKSVYTYLSKEQRNDKEIMYPIMYAIKNEFDTYIVFKYMGGTLQKSNYDLAMQILVKEPEMINETSFKTDEKFKAEASIKNPKIINQVSDIENKLKSILINNSALMEYIVKDPKFASIEILDTVKEIKVEETTNSAIEGFINVSEELRQEIESQKGNLDLTEDQKEELKTKERKVHQSDRHIKFMQKIQNREIDSARAARRILVGCKNLEPEYTKKLEEIVRIEEARQEKLNEKKLKEGKEEEVDNTKKGHEIGE